MPWHPNANGDCEHFNEALADMISVYVDWVQKEWDKHLPLLTAAYCCCKHEATGSSPNILMFGHEVFLPAEIELRCPQASHQTQDYSDHVHELRQKINLVHELARENIPAATEHQKRDYDTIRYQSKATRWET